MFVAAVGSKAFPSSSSFSFSSISIISPRSRYTKLSRADISVTERPVSYKVVLSLHAYILCIQHAHDPTVTRVSLSLSRSTSATYTGKAPWPDILRFFLFYFFLLAPPPPFSSLGGLGGTALHCSFVASANRRKCNGRWYSVLESSIA